MGTTLRGVSLRDGGHWGNGGERARERARERSEGTVRRPGPEAVRRKEMGGGESERGKVHKRG